MATTRTRKRATRKNASTFPHTFQTGLREFYPIGNPKPTKRKPAKRRVAKRANSALFIGQNPSRAKRPARANAGPAFHLAELTKLLKAVSSESAQGWDRHTATRLLGMANAHIESIREDRKAKPTEIQKAEYTHEDIYNRLDAHLARTNPSRYFPKLPTRGRPAHKRFWVFECRNNTGRVISKKTGQGTREEAMKEAAKLARSKGVSECVLDGPRTRAPRS